MSWIVFFLKDDDSQLSRDAFVKLEKLSGITVKHVSKVEISTFTKFMNNWFFILTSFESQTFKYLKNLKMHILSPQIVIDCMMKNQPLPISMFPLINLILNHVEICVSRIGKDEKLKICERIEMMSGTYCETLTSSIKVLIVGTVSSKKYLNSIDKKVIIVKSSWIEYIWKLSNEFKFVDPFSHIIVQSHKVPMFFNLNICLSGFTQDEKVFYQKKIEENGGIYHANLQRNNVDCLIANVAQGVKLRFAILWNVPILSLTWLEDCLKFNKFHDMSMYLYDLENPNNLFADIKFSFFQCTNDFIAKYTLEITKRHGIILKLTNANMDNIHYIIVEHGLDNYKYPNSKYIKSEWVINCIKENKLVCEKDFILKQNNNDIDKINETICIPDINDDIYCDFDSNDIDWDDESMKIFANIKIAFHNCLPSFISKYEDLIKQFGGTIVNCSNMSVTHVIIEDESDKPVLESKVFFLPKKWIIECIGKKQKLSESNFQLQGDDWINDIEFDDDDNNKENSNTTNHFGDDDEDDNAMLLNVSFANSGNDEHNIFDNCKIAFRNCSTNFISQYSQIVQDNGGQVIDINDGSIDSSTYVIVENGKNQDLYTNQYLCVDKSWLEKCITEGRKLPLEEYSIKPLTSVMNDDDFDINDSFLTKFPDDECWDDKVLIDPSADKNGIFANIKFFIDDQVSNSASTLLIENITSNGGFIQTTSLDCDFIVSCLLLHTTYKRGDKVKIVTEFFIKYCLQFKTVFDETKNFLFTPLIIVNKKELYSILVGEIIVLSGFDILMEEEIKRLCYILGGRVCEYDHSQLENQRINCVIGFDSTIFHFRDFVNARIPVVSKEWILECIQQKKSVARKLFLIGQQSLNALEDKEQSPEYEDDDDFDDEMNNFMTVFDEEEENSSKTKEDNSKAKEDTSKVEDNSKVKEDKSKAKEDNFKKVDTSKVEDNSKVKEDTSKVEDNLKVKEDKSKVNEDNLKVKEACTSESISETNLTVTINTKTQVSSNIDLDCEELNASSANEIESAKFSLPKMKRKQSLTSDSVSNCKAIKLFSNYENEQVSSQNTGVRWDYTSKIEEKPEIPDVQIIENTPHTSTAISPLTSVSVGNEINKVNQLTLERVNSSTRVFIFSTIYDSIRSKLASYITFLDATLHQGTVFDKTITHLISFEPNRTEKFIAAMANQCWILHPNYVIDSFKAKYWLNEKQYQWGVNYTVENCSDFVKSKKYSQEHYRIMINALRNKTQIKRPPFQGWKVVLIDSKVKMKKLINILLLGGATVLSIDKGFPPVNEVTHSFLTIKDAHLPIHQLPYDYQWMETRYIPYYLFDELDNPNINVKIPISDINKVNLEIRKNNRQM